MTDWTFWQKVYIAAIRAGSTASSAAEKADAGLNQLGARRSA